MPFQLIVAFHDSNTKSPNSKLPKETQAVGGRVKNIFVAQLPKIKTPKETITWEILYMVLWSTAKMPRAYPHVYKSTNNCPTYHYCQQIRLLTQTYIYCLKLIVWPFGVEVLSILDKMIYKCPNTSHSGSGLEAASSNWVAKECKAMRIACNSSESWVENN